MSLDPHAKEDISDEAIADMIEWENDRKGVLGKYTLVVFQTGRALLRSRLFQTKTTKVKIGDKVVGNLIQRLPTKRWHKFFADELSATEYLINQYIKEFY